MEGDVGVAVQVEGRWQEGCVFCLQHNSEETQEEQNAVDMAWRQCP